MVETVGEGLAEKAGKAEILGHPGGLWWLFTIEMWERFAYYGMRALLILYLTRHFLFQDGYAAGLYGAFTSLVYLTPLVGGLLADKYLGSRKAVGFGAILMSVGYILLSFGGAPAKPVLIHGDQVYEMAVGENLREVTVGDRHFPVIVEPDGGLVIEGSDGAMIPERMDKGSFEFDGRRDPVMVQLLFLSLALVIIGNGFFKPNISTMVGALYRQGDPRRDGGFTIFYMGINLGSVLSQFLCPLIAAAWGWRWGFLLAGIGMALSWLINEMSRRRLGEVGAEPDPEHLRGAGPAGLSREWTIYVLAVLAAGAVWLLIQFQSLAGGMLTGATVIAFAAIIGYSILRCTPAERDRMIVALVLILFSVMFWALFEQAGSSLTLFADRNTDRVIASIGYEMPAGQVQIFNPLFVILLAIPFSMMWTALAFKGREPSTPVKFSLGLLQVGLGFLALVYGAQFADENFRIPLIWMVIAYLLHTTGELCLSPVGLSMITKLSVPRLVGLMMGMWFLAVSLAQYAGGLVAGITSAETVGGQVLDPAKALVTYIDVFQSIGIVAVVVGLVLLVFAPLLKRMMHGIN